MKTNILLILGFIIISISSCEQKDPLQAKQEELKTKKAELQKVKASITELEKEIAILDPEFAKKNRRATLITAAAIDKQTFEHYVEVSGAVKSRKNVMISAENMGNINRILVKEGNLVKKGQLIMSMDVELYQRNLDQLKTELTLAETMFKKQTN